MKKNFLFFLLISGLSFSQQKNLKITDLQPKSEDFNFPTVSYAEKPLVENKINTFLQVDQLEYIPGSDVSPSKLVSSGKTSYSNYVYFYGWEKLETPKNILSIAISGEASGAYPEGFDIWKSFDLRTGNLINAKDLFQLNTIKTVENLIQKSVRKEVNDFLVALKSEKNPSEEVVDQIAMYEGCFTDFTLDGIEYYFAKDKIRFIAGRCSNHAMRALDELGSHVVEFPYKNLEKYWSSYAKNLLSDSEKVNKTSLSNKLYKGKIDGKYPITVLIDKVYDDGSFSAKYWYDKNKKMIEWNGKLKGNHISIIENDYYSEETNQWIFRALVEADLQGNKISGTWQDYKTKKYLKLELEEL
ncbi:hypothetical protein [Chryseobacterium balustinum]|uniref:Protein of uncharacterized function (DUF3298) n=1 Tax=Chryseobacterium balustinum TaxID=246 RepID=A0AAX2IKQ9_9FLAO|nr:hypothetical protein [Chryseobacterium balustinum]AZB27901.1 hypothetical protein EB354_00680 [Chryseobacterium balustinum]SKB53641.1 hypothetical protein SAMN05421800_10318 [Chryseobacterium balustinum]SQA89891.1 Protein of uncharacterised function (DUF3298) [Chryseobacterium balustinum]